MRFLTTEFLPSLRFKSILKLHGTMVLTLKVGLRQVESEGRESILVPQRFVLSLHANMNTDNITGSSYVAPPWYLVSHVPLEKYLQRLTVVVAATHKHSRPAVNQQSSQHTNFSSRLLSHILHPAAQTTTTKSGRPISHQSISSIQDTL